MDQTLVQKMRSEIPTPIIGVIGAASPTRPYTQETGIKLGYVLREYLASHPGTLFTGGVQGVGVDVYIGVTKYCIAEGIRTGKIPNDNFFVLIPKYEASQHFLQRQTALYEPPGEYTALGRLSKRGTLWSAYAGNDMTERRDYVAAIADVLIVAN